MKTTKNKKRSRAKTKLLLWILSAVLAALLIMILVLKPPAVPQGSTDPTEEPAVTLPPPEANPYTAQDFQYENGYLTCTAGESVLGIDVSEHQQQVDWEQVKASGVEFAMIRAGYRGYTKGRIFRDSCFYDHLAGAQTAGLDVGVYFFSQAVNPEEAREEAFYLLSLLHKQPLQMPVVFDWEYVSLDARTGKMDAQTLTQCAKAFCDVIAAAGYESMIYFNPELAESRLELRELTGYPFWLAMYSDEMDFPYRVDMWQYTDAGTVPGIEGDVDLNLYFP